MYPETQPSYGGEAKAVRDGRPLETLDYMIGRAEDQRAKLASFLSRWNGDPQQDAVRGNTVAVPSGYGAKMCRLTDLQHEIDNLICNLHDIG